MKKNLVKTNKPGVYKMVTEPDDYLRENYRDWTDCGTFEMVETRLPNGKHCIDILFRPNEEDSNDSPKSPILLEVMDLKTCKKCINWMTEFYKYCRDNGELDSERKNRTVAFRLSRNEYNAILSNVPEGESISGYLRDMVLARIRNIDADHINYNMVKTSRDVTAGVTMTENELAEFDEFRKQYKASRASMMRKLIFLDSQKLQAL